MKLYTSDYEVTVHDQAVVSASSFKSAINKVKRIAGDKYSPDFIEVLDVSELQIKDTGENPPDDKRREYE